MHRVKMHAFAELLVIIFARGVPARRATLDGRLGEGAESTRRVASGARRPIVATPFEESRPVVGSQTSSALHGLSLAQRKREIFLSSGL